jgi:hypothetical protein
MSAFGVRADIFAAEQEKEKQQCWLAERHCPTACRSNPEPVVTLVGAGVWVWPTVAAALVSRHHWPVIACDTCETVVDLDLRVKPRDPEASVRVALREFRCPRCNGHGRPRVIGLSQHPTI